MNRIKAIIRDPKIQAAIVTIVTVVVTHWVEGLDSLG